MGYRTRVTGELDIVPPLTYPELKNNRWYYDGGEANYYELRINTIETPVDTPEGPLLKIVGVSASYGQDAEPFKAYSMESNLQDLADSLPKGTKLTGYLERMGEDGQQSRVYVRDGKVETVVPKIVWPDWT